MRTQKLALLALVPVLLVFTLACVLINVEPVIVTVEVPITVTPDPGNPQPPEPASPELIIMFDEEFNSASLDESTWTFGTNSSGSGYKVADDILELWSGTTNGGGGYLLSNLLFTPGSVTQVFEIRARTSNSDGGLWGFWGDEHEGYLMFGVNESGLFQAWVLENRSASLESITIENVDITQWHTYRIEFSASEAEFYVDDLLVATHTSGIPAGKPMHIRLDRVSWGQNETIYVDYITVGEIR